jgi:hypothetical protein
MRGKTILMINFLLSFALSFMFLPFFEGYLVGFMFSIWILILAFLTLIILFLSLVYSIQIIFVHKVFKTAALFHKGLMLWPFLQVLIWGIFLLQ